MRDTDDIIDDVMRGNQRAASQLFASTAQALARKLRWLGSDALVDDTVQHTYIEAFRQLERFEKGRSFDAWLYGIAERCARSLQRREHRNAVVPAMVGGESTGSDFGEHTVDARAELSRVLTALTSVSARQRVAFSLARLNGWGVSKVAEVMGSTPQTAWARIDAAEQAIKVSSSPADSSVPPIIDSTRWPVLHIRWPKSVSLPSVKAHFDDMAVYLDGARPLVVVLELEALHVPSREVLLECSRRMRTTLLKAGPRLTLACVVHSRLARGFLQCAWGLSGAPVRFEMHASRDQALRWAEQEALRQRQ